MHSNRYGTAGASAAEACTVSFIGPNGTWTTECDTHLTAANEAISELQLGTATGAHIRTAAYHRKMQRLHAQRAAQKAARP
jgi:hypothetical protein